MQSLYNGFETLASDESVYCRAVKVRLDRLEAPGRKEFKVYKDRLELRYEKLFMIALSTLASDESVLQGSQGPPGPTGSTGPQGVQGIQGPAGATVRYSAFDDILRGSS